MKSLVITGKVAVRVVESQLSIESKNAIESFRPNRIPYDSIIITRPRGYVTFDAIRMLTDKNISLSLMDYENNIASQITPNVNNGIRKMAQFKAYQNEREKFSKMILEGKFSHSLDFLNYLNQRYNFENPKFEQLDKAKTEKEILGIEGINANRYWIALTKLMEREFPEWQFEGRTTK